MFHQTRIHIHFAKHLQTDSDSPENQRAELCQTPRCLILNIQNARLINKQHNGD
jgi:hypothetical protein